VVRNTKKKLNKKLILNIQKGSIKLIKIFAKAFLFQLINAVLLYFLFGKEKMVSSKY